MDVVVFCQEVSVEPDEAWGIFIYVVWQKNIIWAMCMLAFITMLALSSGGPEQA